MIKLKLLMKVQVTVNNLRGNKNKSGSTKDLNSILLLDRTLYHKRCISDIGIITKEFR